MWQLFVLYAIVRLTDGEEICCESSGDCFTDDPPFAGPSWPLPECFTPVFRLYRNGLDGSVNISRGNVPPEYDRSDDTVYIVHGWQGDSDADHVQDMKDAFLRTGDFNIVLVDWRDGAGHAFFPQSSSNVRVTGAEIADINEELNATYSWCVGHSLGAHSCGHAGKAGDRFDRITGLDPAGPNFDLASCAAMAQICRLHRTDALQVDNIHTNGVGPDSYGTLSPLGDIDFYPNGANLQPGCPDTAIDLGCSHFIVNEYFTISIENDCFLVDQQCTDENNLPESCDVCGDEGCPNMGASTNFGSGLYYLETDPVPPYCQE